jgi:hypothetical protein
LAAYDTAFVTSAPPGGAGTGAGYGTFNLPNFVGELFKLSPLETPFLSLIGGLTGGLEAPGVAFTWQDIQHRTPGAQAIDEGADASFTAQERVERYNVVEIFQYGSEISYSKQGGTSLLGTVGTTPATSPAVNILGNQPVQDELSFQMQVLLEQSALDVEWAFINETLLIPNDGTARQTQGIVGAVSTDTSTDWQTPAVAAGPDIVNDLAKKMFDNGAPMRNVVLMVDSQGKVDLGDNYGTSTNWNVQPRSYSVFGVNVTDLETEFGRFPVVLNRHSPANTVLAIELDVCKPRFLPIPGKGHFFMEPLSKSGSYDREQLYGEIGLEYGPAGWHGRAYNLNTA